MLHLVSEAIDVERDSGLSNHRDMLHLAGVVGKAGIAVDAIDPSGWPD